MNENVIPAKLADNEPLISDEMAQKYIEYVNKLNKDLKK